jgi:hypothetical protein
VPPDLVDNADGAEKEVEFQRAYAEKTCGRPLTWSIDWKTVDVAWNDDFTPGVFISYCTQAIGGLAEGCQAGRITDLGKVSKIRCSYVDQSKLTLRPDYDHTFQPTLAIQGDTLEVGYGSSQNGGMSNFGPPIVEFFRDHAGH